MPIVFPGSPADGDYFNVGTKTFIYNSSKQSWAPVPSNATTAAVEPTAKTAGMLWYNTTNNTMGVWNGTTWQYFATTNSLVYPSTNGEASYTAAGTYSWTCPADVNLVHVVCVGGGGGGAQYSGSGGGGLAWCNNIYVVPGQSYTVVVGSSGVGTTSPTSGGNSYFKSTGTVIAYGGVAYGAGGGYYPNGGMGGAGIFSGGGAGGYTGFGGQGGNYGNGSDGTGGGGAGGGYIGTNTGAAGGGVGILGAGTSGLAITAQRGGGGSGGVGGGSTQIGGAFGGGGGAGMGGGGVGAVRIIWGPARAFPSTNTGML